MPGIQWGLATALHPGVAREVCCAGCVFEEAWVKSLEFGKLSDHLGYMLHRVDAVLMRKAAAAFDTLGLTPARATAAVYIGLHEGCDQAALGRALGINRASTMKVVNELVALGVVARREGRNRRTNALHLTKRGQALRHDIEKMSEQTDAAHFNVLTRQEQGELRRLLAKIQAASADSDETQAFSE